MDNPEVAKVTIELTSDSVDWATLSRMANYLGENITEMKFPDLDGKSHMIGEHFTVARCAIEGVNKAMARVRAAVAKGVLN